MQAAGSTARDQGAVHEAGKGQQGRLGVDREIGVRVYKQGAAWHSRHLVADGIGVPAHDIMPALNLRFRSSILQNTRSQLHEIQGTEVAWDGTV